MPKSFEKAIVEGCFDKAVEIIAGCTSEEGLILSCQFEKLPNRWNMFFNKWDRSFLTGSLTMSL